MIHNVHENRIVGFCAGLINALKSAPFRMGCELVVAKKGIRRTEKHRTPIQQYKFF